MPWEKNMRLDDKTKELIAIGCSVTANCHPCIKYHTKKAHDLGLDDDAIDQAIRVGKMVRKGAAGEMDKLLNELAGVAQTDTPGCCG
jgi:AhpD family alkylhydroperoxidase